jgi:assimilatory nitrate reductase catalytic subunit
VQPRERAADEAYPLRLNTARYRDQWHTMTRTGLSPRLSQHRREPLVEVHPDDAARYGLNDNGLARVSSPAGDSVFRVQVTDNQAPGSLCVPMHWTDQMSSSGRANLMPGKDRDPVSGQPGFKNSPATIAPVKTAWSGFFLTDQPPPPSIKALYWTKVRTASGWLIELAGDGDPALLLALLPQGDHVELVDSKRGVIRAAVVTEGRLHAALFITRDADLPPRDWLIAQLGGAEASPVELIAGRPAKPMPDRGPIICVCFDVGLNTILEAITTGALTSVAAVGTAIQAGTNCGSCRPAIARLLEPQEAACA